MTTCAQMFRYSHCRKMKYFFASMHVTGRYFATNPHSGSYHNKRFTIISFSNRLKQSAMHML